MLANIRVSELLRHVELFSSSVFIKHASRRSVNRKQGERMYGLAMVLGREKKMHQQAIVERALSEADQRVQLW